MRFPIFRSLQRSMAVGAIGTRKPAIAVTAHEQLLQHKDEKEEGIDNNSNDDDDDASSSSTTTPSCHLPHGHHHPNHNQGDAIQLDNPATWPINSNEARQMRHEFVQDGFRRLYAKASLMLSSSSSESEIGSFRHGTNQDADGVGAAVRELGWHFGRRLDPGLDDRNNDGGGGDGGGGGGNLSSVHEEDWMYLPQ